MGEKDSSIVLNDYFRTVRITYNAAVKYNANARVYLSLARYWNVLPESSTRSLKGKYFVDEFQKMARSTGDFNWHIAYHPYPLGNPAWENHTLEIGATSNIKTTACITPRNIEILRDYLNTVNFIYNNKPRSIILAEQGFFTNGSSDYNRQAAELAYTYYKVKNIKGIDAFIYYLYDDRFYLESDGDTAWCRFGLVTSNKEKKPIYNVFKYADKPEWQTYFDLYKSTIGIRNWNSILPGFQESSMMLLTPAINF